MRYFFIEAIRLRFSALLAELPRITPVPAHVDYAGHITHWAASNVSTLDKVLFTISLYQRVEHHEDALNVFQRFRDSVDSHDNLRTRDRRKNCSCIAMYCALSRSSK